MAEILCKYCETNLYKDEIALNKKLLGKQIKQFMCLQCLADYLDCETEDLLVKIEEFKEQGCNLFG